MEESERATSRDGGVASSDETATSSDKESTDDGTSDRYVEYLLDLLSFF